MAKAKAKAKTTQLPANRRVVASRRQVTARYDAAQTTPNNRRHWTNADTLDAVKANSKSVRSLLRKRSRYEVSNNSYAKGIVLTLANDTIGIGPRLQMLTEDSGLNTHIENEFIQWSKTIDLGAKLRTMRMARTQDGEAFAVMFSNGSQFPITLDLRLVEADQVDSPYGKSKYKDGIEFDQNGVPQAYALLKNHPGAMTGMISFGDFDRIEAKYMLHWFRIDRPGQIRGIPETTPALPLFAQLRRYTLAVVSAAEMAAEMTMFLKTSGPPASEPTEIKDGDFAEIEVERNLMTTLPEGWEPFQLKAEQPATTYDMFKKEILNEIARCLNMPFNVAAGNSSGYNYASGRLDHQVYFKALRIDQSQCEVVVLDRILAAWLAEAARVFSFGQVESFPHQWFWDGREHVDPAKEAKAQAQLLASNTTTLAAEYAKKGKDWETELRQRAKEVQLERELGLTTVSAPEDEPDEVENSNAEEGAAK